MTTPREDAIERALLYVFQLSDKDFRKMQTAMSGEAFVRALEQDGYTVATLGAEAETPNPYYDHSDAPPWLRESPPHWVDLASPETAEALAQTLADMDIWDEVHKHEDTNTLAAAILAAMRETR